MAAVFKNGKLYLIMNYKNGKIRGRYSFDSNGDITEKQYGTSRN